jgi:7-carboxy-7-deazaguanine synthase
MTYSVKEVFYTLQGEGANAGRAAVFCRFSGCNLWSGREEDRLTSVCKFCDTDFIGTDGIGGGKFGTADALAEHVSTTWGGKKGKNITPLVVCTGGEPALQLNSELVEAFHQRGFEVAIETNGTLMLADNIDWVCVSPKSTAKLVINSGDELKLVYPQHDALPEKFINLDFHNFFIQPMDGPEVEENTQQVIDFCKTNPSWRISIQMHKILNIP